MDIVLVCTGSDTNGTGSRDIVLVLNTLSSSSLHGTNMDIQNIASTMELVEEKTDFFVSTTVSIGVTESDSNGNSQVKFQYIYC